MVSVELNSRVLKLKLSELQLYKELISLTEILCLPAIHDTRVHCLQLELCLTHDC